MNVTYAGAVVCSLLMAGATPALAQNDSRLDRLEDAVKKLQQENEALRKELNSLKGSPQAATAAAATNTVSGVPTATNRTPFALNIGKSAKLKLGGFIQGNGEFGDPGSFEGNFADNELNPARNVVRDRIRLRRARVTLTGEFFEDFDFKMEGDFAQGDGLSSGRTGFSATDVFANWHRFPEAQIKLGQWKSPFGLEHITSDTALFTIERSLPTTALTQDRQVGIALWGKPLAHLASKDYADALEYSFGVFNGSGRNTTLNDNDQFMYVGRLAATPLKTKVAEETLSWRLGVNAYTSRFAAEQRVSPAGNLRVSGVDGALSPLSPAVESRATGWGVDQWFTFGPFDLIAEYLEGKYEPHDGAGFAEFTANGYYVQPSYFLPFFGGRKLQVVGRYESFNPDQAMDDDIQSVIGGVNYYINGDALKVMVNYVHTWSEFRHTRLGTGDDEFDALLARFQLMF